MQACDFLFPVGEQEGMASVGLLLVLRGCIMACICISALRITSASFVKQIRWLFMQISITSNLAMVFRKNFSSIGIFISI